MDRESSTSVGIPKDLNPALSSERAGTHFLWPCASHTTRFYTVVKPYSLTFHSNVLLSLRGTSNSVEGVAQVWVNHTWKATIHDS